MKPLDLMIKYKLWSVGKHGSIFDLEEKLENYLYDNARFEIIEEIKTPKLLEKYLKNFIKNEHNYKYEKRMFAYLQENLKSEKIKEIINQYSHQGLLLYWIKRNQNKTPHWDFLDYLDKNILENGIFLSYAEKSSEKIIKHAIDSTKSHTLSIAENLTINLLTLKNIKNDLKIQLLSKFKEEVRKDILNHVFDSIKNEDEKTSYWLIEEFKQDIFTHKDKTMNPLRCPYNKIMESILSNKENYDLFFEKSPLFIDTFFHKVLAFKEQNKSIENPIDATFKQFKKWRVEIPEREFNSIFFKLVNYETLDYFLAPEQGFNIEKKVISVESLLYKMNQSEEKEILPFEIFKSYIEKIYQSGFHYIERGSNLFFLDNVNSENMNYLLEHPLFNYNLNKLMHSMWTRDKELGMQFAKSIDKEIVWKYVDSLKTEERVQFELRYYEEKFDNKTKEKRLKI